MRVYWVALLYSLPLAATALMVFIITQDIGTNNWEIMFKVLIGIHMTTMIALLGCVLGMIIEKLRSPGD